MALYVWPTVNTTITGVATEVTAAAILADTTSIDGKITACDTTALALESGGNLAALVTKTSGALVPVSYDNIAVNLAGATADVYTYKVGVATVATVTITYVDATKAVISTIVRT